MGAFVVTALLLFTVTTFVYTSILVSNTERNSLESLETNLQTFEYSLGRLRSEALAQARVVTANQNVRKALKAKEGERLNSLLGEMMLSAGTDFLAVTDEDGAVLARGEDPEAVGDFLSAKTVVASSLEGEERSDIAVREWVVAPQIIVEAAAPIGKLGVVYTGYVADNAFVDGVKEATGLDVTIFGGEVKAATTLVAADGVSRLVGVRQADEKVREKVLGEGEAYLGLSTIFHEEYLSAYGPLKNSGEELLGMLFVGYPATVLSEITQTSLDVTFLASVFLALLSFVPAYLLAKYIEKHQV
jgi:sensor histidine kinase regulating citrate/malate metabolism